MKTLGWLWLIGMLWVSACIPAQEVPANLDDTPGPPFTVADGWYRGAVFSARYPDGWRIVSGEASRPQSVIFVAPDNVSYVQLALEPITAVDPNVPLRQAEIARSDGTTLYVALIALEEQQVALQSTYQGIIDSIEFNPE